MSRHRRLIHARKHATDEQPQEPAVSALHVGAAAPNHTLEQLSVESPSVDSIRLPLSNTATDLPPSPTQMLENPSLQASHPASSYEQSSTFLVEGSSYEDTMPYVTPVPIGDPMQDFSAFIESIGLTLDWENEGFLSGDYLPPSGRIALERDLAEERSQHCATGQSRSPDRRLMGGEVPFSNFGSRLPSLQPESRHDDTDENGLLPHRVQSLYNISHQDHQKFVERLGRAGDMLPLDFRPPSRYALSCSIDGFVDGLNEHLPFIHAPTLSISRCSPALTLAIAACGSQFRFESTRGLAFFHAARALLLDELDAQKPPKLRTRQQHQIESCATRHEQQRITGDSMENIQTLLLLTIFATWGNNLEILQDILSLQGVLAALTRAHGLCEPDTPSRIEVDGRPENWFNWVRQERDRRTKLVAYTFHNLHSLMYNTAPLILNSELQLNLPCPTALWKAGSAIEWQLAFEANPKSSIPF